MRLVKNDDGSWRSWDSLRDDCMDNVETMEVVEVPRSDRKTIAVCKRFLPMGEQDTACMIVEESTTVGEINKWCDNLCSGKTVCLRLELVDQYRGT